MSRCAHSDPPDIMRKAEVWLRESGIPESEWTGKKIRHAENTPGAMWESVIIDIERRGAEWVVTKIDRRPDPLDEPEGLRFVG